MCFSRHIVVSLDLGAGLYVHAVDALAVLLRICLFIKQPTFYVSVLKLGLYIRDQQ